MNRLADALANVNRNDRAIVGLVAVGHATVHTLELSVPIFVTGWLAEFSTVDLGVAAYPVTTATLGLVVSAGYALFGLGALPGGILVDRVGSKRLIAGCLFGMAGSFLLLGAAPGLVAVAVALVVWGAAASVYHPAGLSLLSKGVAERGKGFAYHGIAGNVGIGLGPLVVAVALLFLDWRTVATLLAVPAAVGGVFALRADIDETAAVEDAGAGGASADGGRATAGVSSFAEFAAATRALFTGRFVLVFVVVVCSGLFYRGVLTFLPDLLSGFPAFEPIALSELLGGDSAAAGGRVVQPQEFFYSGLLTVGILGQYVGGRLTDRIPPEKGIALAFGALTVLAVAFVPAADAGLPALLVVGAGLGFALFTAQPLYQAAVAEYSPAGTRGLSYGFVYLGVFGVGALGGALAGGVLSVASPLALFVVLAGFALTASFVGAYLWKTG